MKQLSKDQVRNILNSRPANMDAETVISNLVSKGYVLEGLNDGTKTTQESQTEAKKPGLLSRGANFLGNVAKDIARPFATAGVTGLAAIEGAGRAAVGDIKGADRVLTEGYNVPLLGQIKPVGASIGQAGGVKRELGRMVGTGAELASNLMGAGAAKGLIQSGGKTALKSLALQGAKEGALVGATGGFGSSIQDENVSAGNVVLKSAGGALLGGVLGAAAAPLAKVSTQAGRTALKSEKLVSQSEKLAEYVMPVMNQSEKTQAIIKNRGIAPTLFSEADIAPGVYEKRMAEAVKGIIDPKKDMYSNVDALNGAVSREADLLAKEVGSKNIIFNQAQLSKKLDSIEPPIMVQSDPVLEKNYILAKQKFMTFVGQEPKNVSGLLSARKKFDAWVIQNFPNIYDDISKRPLQQALKDMRNAANDFIAEKLPDGSLYRNSLKKQSLLLDARDNLAEKAVKQGSGNKVSQWAKKHPFITTAIGAGAGSEIINQARKALGQ